MIRCGRLTLEEKAMLMLDESPAIPRLGIKKFFWWSEALHGAANMDHVTVFPEPVALSKVLSFEKALLEFAHSKYDSLIKDIDAKPDYSDDIANKLSDLIKDFKSTQTF